MFCLSPGDKQFVCPPGDKHFLHTGGGGQTFFTHRRGDKHFSHTGGGQTFFVGGGGSYDYVDEEIIVSAAKVFRGPKALKFKYEYILLIVTI